MSKNNVEQNCKPVISMTGSRRATFRHRRTVTVGKKIDWKTETSQKWVRCGNVLLAGTVLWLKLISLITLNLLQSEQTPALGGVCSKAEATR